MRDARVRLGLGRGRPARATSASSSSSSSRTFATGPCEVGPVVSDGGGAPLHLAGEQERRQRLGDVVEDAAPALLLGLDLLPALPHAARRPSFGLAEHVRVPADELLVNGAGDALEVAVALLLEEQREEVDLEEQVAELVGELGRIVADGGVRDLVRLLDGVRDDRARGLLAVPRAVGRRRRVSSRSSASGASASTRSPDYSPVGGLGLFAGRRVGRLEARRRTDLALVLLPDLGGPLGDRFRLPLLERAGFGSRSDLGERRDRPGLDRGQRLDQVVAVLRLDGLESSPVSRLKAVCSNGATVWPRVTRSACRRCPSSLDPASSSSRARRSRRRPRAVSGCRSASAFVLTRMWRTSRDSATVYSVLFCS